MRDHAHVNDIVWWPAGSEWAWTVDTIITATEGPRLLAISRGDTDADINTRVVEETAVSSNAFQLTP